MNPWREVLKALQAELDRLSQEIEGKSVLPNSINALLPAARFERWAPILEAVTAELGEALVAWVEGSRRGWYADVGPFLTVQLDSERTQTEVRCGFLESPPGENPVTEAEPLAQEPAADPAPSDSARETAVRGVDVAARYEPAVREETETGGAALAAQQESDGLSRFELDSSPYRPAPAEMPEAEPTKLRPSERDDEDHLSQIELD